MPKLSNEEFAAEFEDFADFTIANKDELNLSTADQTKAAALKTALNSKLATLQSAKMAFDSAEADFNGTRTEASEFKKSRKKFFGSNPSVSAATKAGLNIETSASSSTGGTFQPLDLSAKGFENGENQLKWKRNGNPPYRNFTVEYRVGENGAWLIAGTTRKTSFTHKNQTPGVKVYYRVYAHSDDEQSAHSNTAVVYA